MRVLIVLVVVVTGENKVNSYFNQLTLSWVCKLEWSLTAVIMMMTLMIKTKPIMKLFDTGIVMHELMHAAGFWHEQSRADRDDYITINWSNIRKGMEYNFLKYDLRKIDHLGAKYDTCSVMHYGAYAFAKVRNSKF